MHGLEAEYWNEIDFVYLDREARDNADVVSEFGIRYQPVFVLVDADGNEIERWTVLSPDDMRARLDAALAASGG